MNEPVAQNIAFAYSACTRKIAVAIQCSMNNEQLARIVQNSVAEFNFHNVPTFVEFVSNLTFQFRKRVRLVFDVCRLPSHVLRFHVSLAKALTATKIPIPSKRTIAPDAPGLANIQFLVSFRMCAVRFFQPSKNS